MFYDVTKRQQMTPQPVGCSRKHQKSKQVELELRLFCHTYAEMNFITTGQHNKL